MHSNSTRHARKKQCLAAKGDGARLPPETTSDNPTGWRIHLYAIPDRIRSPFEAASGGLPCARASLVVGVCAIYADGMVRGYNAR